MTSAFLLFRWLICVAFAGTASLSAEPLRVNGSTTVNPVVAEAAEALRTKYSMEIRVDTQGGSSGGISTVAEDLAEVGMISRDLEAGDREKYPAVNWHVTTIGRDAVALVVSRDVHEGGVSSLSRQEVQGIYEQTIRNWKAVGGPDRRIVLFNKEPGRGTWEVFAKWAYGNAADAPLVSHPEVGGNEEGRSKTASTPGAITQLSAAWADGKSVFPLALEKEDGSTVSPTPEAIESDEYPMARPLNLVTNGPPTPDARVLIDYLLSPAGQEIVRKHGYEPLAGKRE